MDSNVTLSVAIVNYNTKEELNNCLISIFNSKQDTKFSVFVVDNNSNDGSANYVESVFPQVSLIKNNQNLGFARANNQVLANIQSEFVLLLNPDTIVYDHVFDLTIEFLRNTQEAGMVTCKLLKPDQKLDLACRRSFPSVFDGFCRAVGLSRLFPKSRIFARYNMTYLDENETNEVDAVNGAFMMIKKQALNEVGLFDENYFMYMEDLDLCFRFRRKGWKIFYFPKTKVLHLKGKSGKKDSERMILEFFRSMELFCNKNYSIHQSPLEGWITKVGIRSWKVMTLYRNKLRLSKRVTP